MLTQRRITIKSCIISFLFRKGSSKYLLGLVLIMIISIAASASHFLENVLLQRYLLSEILGVSGTITWNNPNLNGGNGVAQRVAVYREERDNKKFTFVEVGHAKIPEGYFILVAFKNFAVDPEIWPNGKTENIFLEGYTGQARTYKIKKFTDGLGFKWHRLYADNVLLFNVSKNNSTLGTADGTLAGGEVLDHVESMNNICYSNLQYKDKINGINVWDYWWSWSQYFVSAPHYGYTIVTSSPLSFCTNGPN